MARDREACGIRVLFPVTWVHLRFALKRGHVEVGNWPVNPPFIRIRMAGEALSVP